MRREGSGFTRFAGSGRKWRRNGGAPVTFSSSLGARFAGEEEGKRGGARGLLIGQEMASLYGFNCPKSCGGILPCLGRDFWLEEEERPRHGWCHRGTRVSAAVRKKKNRERARAGDGLLMGSLRSRACGGRKWAKPNRERKGGSGWLPNFFLKTPFLFQNS